jgi:hypothetical protein
MSLPRCSACRHQWACSSNAISFQCISPSPLLYLPCALVLALSLANQSSHPLNRSCVTMTLPWHEHIALYLSVHQAQGVVAQSLSKVRRKGGQLSAPPTSSPIQVLRHANLADCSASFMCVAEPIGLEVRPVDLMIAPLLVTANSTWVLLCGAHAILARALVCGVLT